MRNALHSLPLAALFVLAFHENALPEGAPAAVGQLEPRSVADEVALLEKGRLRAQKNALGRLAVHTDAAAAKALCQQFERLEAGEFPPTLWLELFEAAAKRGTPELKALLAERERKLEKATDPLVRFAECLKGGDADAGRVVFFEKPEAGCVRCHAIDGKGASIGPDLTWLRNSVDRVHILESLILPNTQIALGFDHAALKLKSGEEVSGIVTTETDVDLTITSVADGKKRELKANAVEKRTTLPSPMPPHFGMALGKREIRDLIEFLADGN